MKLAFVWGYKPATRYRLFGKYRNGITLWVRGFGCSLAMHAFTPSGGAEHG